MNPLFKGVTEIDVKDLINFFIQTLHEELNKAGKKKINNSGINQDKSDKQLMFNLFIQDFTNNHRSIISDLFYMVVCNIQQCQRCHSESYNYQTYSFFEFPLEEVRKFKNKNNLNNNLNYNINLNNNEVNIYDCFLYYQRINENTVNCNFCRTTSYSSMANFIFTGPEILIIILDRGKGFKYNLKLNFVEKLNLDKFIERKDAGVDYQLIGVITHIGESDMSGHFIAYCKDPISNAWYKFDDSIVNQVTNFKTEVIDFSMPYVLFYQNVLWYQEIWA